MKILEVVFSDTLVIILGRKHASEIYSTPPKSKKMILKILESILLAITKNLKKCFVPLKTTLNQKNKLGTLKLLSTKAITNIVT